MRRVTDAIVRALLAVALTTTFAACGGDDPNAGEDGEAILIKTQVRIHIPEGGVASGSPSSEGKVLRGSSIGDSPSCTSGTFGDRHGNDEIGLVDRTFRCPEGGLRIGFTPGVPQGRTQAGPWKIVSGTGAFEGLQGSGQMETTYERGSRTNGRETFTGTVSRGATAAIGPRRDRGARLA